MPSHPSQNRFTCCQIACTLPFPHSVGVVADDALHPAQRSLLRSSSSRGLLQLQEDLVCPSGKPPLTYGSAECESTLQPASAHPMINQVSSALCVFMFHAMDRFAYTDGWLDGLDAGCYRDPCPLQRGFKE